MAGQGPPRSEFDELVDIERATALLQNRDPSQAEAIVAARLSATTQRKDRDERVAKARADADRRRRAKLRNGALAVVGVGLAVAIAVPVSRSVMREASRAEALRAALTRASAGAVEAGFAKAGEWAELPPVGVNIDVAPGTCAAVVAVHEGDESSVRLRVERGLKGKFEGDGGLIWCACEKERVSVAVANAGEGRYALRWLSVTAERVGGVTALGVTKLTGFTPHVGEFDRSCSDQAFAAWSQVGDHGALPPLGAEPEGMARTLVGEGLEPAGLFPPDRRFGIVHADKGRCYFAAPDGGSGPISVRGPDGSVVVDATSKAVGFCAYADGQAPSLWREAGSTVRYVLFGAPANRLGGLAGLRELAFRLQLAPCELLALGDATNADAQAALDASGVTASSIELSKPQGLPGTFDHRVVAFSFRQGGSFRAGGSPAVAMACRPREDPTNRVDGHVCVQATPQPWIAEGNPALQAAAEASLPFWLTVLADTTEPEALEAMALGLALGRRLTLAGFEPTVTDGVQDAPTGATVNGRKNKKVVVALGITKARPWIQPLAPLGARPWTLDGDPPLTELPADGKVELRAALSLGSDAANRRVVVWRR